MLSDNTVKKQICCLPPTNDGDVAYEGTMDVTEATIAVEVPGLEPGQGRGVRLCGRTGNSWRERLCGRHACCHGNRRRGGEGLGGAGWC